MKPVKYFEILRDLFKRFRIGKYRIIFEFLFNLLPFVANGNTYLLIVFFQLFNGFLTLNINNDE